MRSIAECLILEDDKLKASQIKQAAEKAGFYPRVAYSALQALNLLELHMKLSPPVLAIIDRDMTYAPDKTRTSLEVLSFLSRKLPECLTIVYSANLSTPEARVEIIKAHPRAFLHDKYGTEEDLFTRIEAILGKKVGDLSIKNGNVVHLPSGDLFHHYVAISLILQYPNAVFLRTETMTKAKSRFSIWLKEHNSNVTLKSLGDKRYLLKVKEE